MEDVAMSFFGSLVGYFEPSVREKEIIRQLKDHPEQYVINENGTVTVDLSNSAALQRVKNELRKFKDFDPSAK
jgi:hypothetical protein